MKDWRIARGYTQEDLGNKVGLKSSQIYHYEKGIHIITIKRLDAIAEALPANIKALPRKNSELIEKGNIEVERSDEDREGVNGLLDLVREYNKIEDEEIRDKFYSLIISISKKIQIDKERGKK
ncbi:MAG: helix-turn-helix domain-containing protein [Wolbachia sp.]